MYYGYKLKKKNYFLKLISTMYYPITFEIKKIKHSKLIYK